MQCRTVLLLAPVAGFGLLGAANGSQISKRVRRREGPANVHEAFEQLERSG
jgi:hypothetical protein